MIPARSQVLDGPVFAGRNLMIPARSQVQGLWEEVINFLQETKQELNKVTWPSKNELWQATAVVITATFIMAIFIGIIDFFLSGLMRVLLG